jgi:hypothetical protein
MKEDGLLYGVNLHELQIDRDRKAGKYSANLSNNMFVPNEVVHKYDIDRRVSDIWSKAIMSNNKLIPTYYEMLKNDHLMTRQSQCK